MRAALQFLTVVPLGRGTRSPADGAWAFPMVGALLGVAAAPLLGVSPLGPALALALVTALTGGLHEDGLADVCDALRGYRTRERMHAILKDSRIGAHGAAALALSMLIRWQALSHMQSNAWLRLPAAYGVSRASMVVLAAWSKPAGEGLGSSFVGSLPRYAVWLAGLQALAMAALAGWPAGAILIGMNAAALAWSRAWFHRRLGGVTGDCLGFQCQLSETISLAALTWV